MDTLSVITHLTAAAGGILIGWALCRARMAP